MPGTITVRWPAPLGRLADLFVDYNHNVRSLVDRWKLDSNQLVTKVQCAGRR